MMDVSKADFARKLNVTAARVSQWVRDGLPVLENGRLDTLEALAWLDANLDAEKGRKTLALARAEMRVEAYLRGIHGTASAAVQRIPEAVILAAAHAGISREIAEKLADLAPVFAAVAINEDLAAAGVAEVELEHPEEWRRRIDWPALFDAEGRSVVAE
jgi:hypothetical protein